MIQGVTSTGSGAGAQFVRGNRTLPGALAPRPWLQDFWLWILLIGPLVAPLFIALDLAVLRPFADGIYLLGQTVCPKVHMHFMAFGNPLAVCSSCWSAVFGLWTIRLLYGRAGEGMGPFSLPGLRAAWARWESVPSSGKLAVLAAGFLPWAVDVMMWDLGVWASPHAVMVAVGYMGGLAAGMVLLPAASEMRTRMAGAKGG
jgi:hypothetical protein